VFAAASLCTQNNWPQHAVPAVFRSFFDLGRSCQLWLTNADGEVFRFDGFKALEFDKLSAALVRAESRGVDSAPFQNTFLPPLFICHMQPSSIELKRRALSSKGRNWGSARVRYGQLELIDSDSRMVAPIPVSSLSQVALPGKGEVDLQFLDDEDAGLGEREDEVLVEMRLFVPDAHQLAGVEDMAAEVAKAKARAKARSRGGGGGGGGGSGV
jgi:hypothetical protein